MYNPNERVAGMLARASGNRSSHHGNPMDNVRTGAGMVARAISNRSSYHGNNTDNASVKRSRRHGEPIDNAGASASKPNAEYVGKDKYPISIFKLEEVFGDCIEEEIRLRFANFLGDLPQWRPQRVRSDHACFQWDSNVYVLCQWLEVQYH